MDTQRKFLNGDIHWLENVNKIVPRKMELPLLMQSKIQIKKNLYGIKSRLLKHMQSYDYKFRSLASENKQVIRALRSSSHPAATSLTTKQQSHKVSRIDRSLLEKSSAWKLPPNVYRRLGENLLRPQAGKLGPYQCFTVERDDSTVKNHYAPKSTEDGCKVDFYDLPSLNNPNTNVNLHKNKFLKAKRFPTSRNDETPPPTKYFPQNFSISLPKSANVTKSKIIEADPVFYYPHTTVPEREMTFNKEPRSQIEPGRYNPHDVTCRCHLKATMDSTRSKRCAGKIDGEGHTHVFDSTVPRLVHVRSSSSSGGARRRRSHFMRSKDDMALQATTKKNRHEREPISFRVRSSIDVHEEDVSHQEVRFNTMVRKRSLFSLKTGNVVGFLSASPRFEETAEKPIKLYEKPNRVASLVLSSWSTAAEEEEENTKKSSVKRMTKQRLEELAMPRNALPKRKAEKIQVYTKLPPPTIPTTTPEAAISIQDVNSANMLDVDNLQCGFSHVDVVKLRAVKEEHDEENTANVIREE